MQRPVARGDSFLWWVTSHGKDSEFNVFPVKGFSIVFEFDWISHFQSD